MLVTADRGFFSYQLWLTYMLTGADLLWRVTKTARLPVLQVLPDGSYLSEVTRIKQGKARIPIDKIDDPHLATHIPVRVIAEMLGVPKEDGDKFRVFIHRVLEAPGSFDRDEIPYEETLDYYLKTLIAERRANPTGGDDLVN